jgi:hypothetical protein
MDTVLHIVWYQTFADDSIVGRRAVSAYETEEEARQNADRRTQDAQEKLPQTKHFKQWQDEPDEWREPAHEYHVYTLDVSDLIVPGEVGESVTAIQRKLSFRRGNHDAPFYESSVTVEMSLKPILKRWFGEPITTRVKVDGWRTARRIIEEPDRVLFEVAEENHCDTCTKRLRRVRAAASGNPDVSFETRSTGYGQTVFAVLPPYEEDGDVREYVANVLSVPIQR